MPAGGYFYLLQHSNFCNFLPPEVQNAGADLMKVSPANRDSLIHHGFAAKPSPFGEGFLYSILELLWGKGEL